jgi:UDP-GlcNAc:undecaprenyl-phosphate GlcNAc-1-phosphate transferase
MMGVDAVLALWLSLIVSTCSIPLLKRVALRFNVIAQPAADRWSAHPIPLLGGVAIVAAFACGTLFASRGEWYLLACVFLLLLVGLIDDGIKLQPLTKLGMQALVIGLATLQAPRIALFASVGLNSAATFFGCSLW